MDLRRCRLSWHDGVEAGVLVPLVIEMLGCCAQHSVDGIGDSLMYYIAFDVAKNILPVRMGVLYNGEHGMVGQNNILLWGFERSAATDYIARFHNLVGA